MSYEPAGDGYNYINSARGSINSFGEGTYDSLQAETGFTGHRPIKCRRRTATGLYQPEKSVSSTDH